MYISLDVLEEKLELLSLSSPPEQRVQDHGVARRGRETEVPRGRRLGLHRETRTKSSSTFATCRVPNSNCSAPEYVTTDDACALYTYAVHVLFTNTIYCSVYYV